MNPIHEDTLNKALARLVAVEVPDGLEERVLARLAAAPAPQPRAAHRLAAQVRHQLALLRPRRPLLATAAAFAALVVAAGGLRHLAPHHPTRTVDLSMRRIARLPVPLVPLPEEQHAPLLPTPAQPALSQAHGPASTLVGSTLDEAITDADRALAELRAPSQLAPPLPLTEDERTLLQLAKRNSPEILETLDATHRAVQQAEEEAAFDAFFTPPSPLHNELLGASE